MIEQDASTGQLHVITPRGGNHLLEIDDASNFSSPVVALEFHGKKAELDIDQAGLIPGMDYFFRVDQGAPTSQRIGFARVPATVDRPQISCTALRHTWETTGRFDAGRALSGLRWAQNHWEIVPHSYLLGEHLYNVELLLRPALSAARACHDLQTMDEIAQYFTIMLRQTETVGDLLARPRVTAETRARLKSADPSARTFAATWKSPGGDEAGEGELFNAQWMHPAALLVRLVTMLPPQDRSAAMQDFAAQYTAFLVKEQLLRFLFDQTMPALDGAHCRGRVAYWEAVMHGAKSGDPVDLAMSDIDLWLLASAAEMLGAHANDGQLVPLEPEEVRKLRLAISTGDRFLLSKRTVHPDTKNFSNETVNSVDYFEGEYATHSDMAFSAVGGQELPSQSQRKAVPTVSWDTSHIYRLPVVLRALYENRKASGATFPQFADLQGVANQYVYKVFNRRFTQPLFHNFFDGSDGWFRVDYNGQGFGHPPSEFCDMHDPRRLCLVPGTIMGWPELAFASADLVKVEDALLRLGFSQQPEIKGFRDRHYFLSAPYGPVTTEGAAAYGGAFYSVAAENADRLISPAGIGPVAPLAGDGQRNFREAH
jgi:hypothetical protein